MCPRGRASRDLCAASASAQHVYMTALDGVAAQRIVTTADADHVASTYADGRLNPDPEPVDSLTILDPSDGTWRMTSVPISNSVNAAPEILALDAPVAWPMLSNGWDSAVRA